MTVSTYVINLKTSTRRRAHMEKLLADCPYLDATFINAINGYLLSDSKCEAAFDIEGALIHTGRMLSRGEIGRALSHRLCYHRLLDSTALYALVLEDDVTVTGDLQRTLDAHADATLSTDEPRVMLLSGNYWYWHHVPTPRVVTAKGAYAYLINRGAAERLLTVERPLTTADDWDFFQHLGVIVMAVCPHVIETTGTITSEDVSGLLWRHDELPSHAAGALQHYAHDILDMALSAVGHHEPATTRREVCSPHPG